jgi:phenylacetate-CoA ligase
MLKVKGVKFWPKTVEHALLSVKGVSENYQIVVDRPKDLDEMTIIVEPTEEVYKSVNGDLSKLSALKKEIEDSVRSIVGISANIILVSCGEIPRSVGKAKRVVDKRKID